MAQKIFHILSQLFQRYTGKTLFYYTKSDHNNLGKTAVWCDLGFWYVGNVYDTADIAYGIAQNGVVEKEEVTLVDTILAKLQKEKGKIIFYDIGANTGFYGVMAAKKHKASVESFEPLSEHVACIQETAHINNIDTIHTHTIALGAENAEAELSLAGSGSTLTKGFLGTSDSPKRTVLIKKLDEMNLLTPHFIKIDVEGYEYSVLQGAKSTIAGSLPICFVEIVKTFQSRNVINDNFDKTIGFFTELGYKAYLYNKKLVPIAEANIPDGVNMYLFVPSWFTL